MINTNEYRSNSKYNNKLILPTLPYFVKKTRTCDIKGHGFKPYLEHMNLQPFLV